MSGSNYVFLAYTIALGLIWGYAVVLWLRLRGLNRRRGGGAASR